MEIRIAAGTVLSCSSARRQEDAIESSTEIIAIVGDAAQLQLFAGVELASLEVFAA